MAKSRNCHWCQCEIFPARDVGSTAPNARTIDHVKCKAECGSRGEYVNEKNKVFACHACNQRRNDEYMALHPKPEKIQWLIEYRNWNRMRREHEKQFGKISYKTSVPSVPGLTHY